MFSPRKLTDEELAEHYEEVRRHRMKHSQASYEHKILIDGVYYENVADVPARKRHLIPNDKPECTTAIEVSTEEKTKKAIHALVQAGYDYDSAARLVEGVRE